MIAELLTVEQVAKMMGCSVRTIDEYTRRDCSIPHRVLPHGRRILFEREALNAWMDGAELERIDIHGGGRIVRPHCRMRRRRMSGPWFTQTEEAALRRLTNRALDAYGTRRESKAIDNILRWAEDTRPERFRRHESSAA